MALINKWLAQGHELSEDSTVLNWYSSKLISPPFSSYITNITHSDLLSQMSEEQIDEFCKLLKHNNDVQYNLLKMNERSGTSLSFISDIRYSIHSTFFSNFYYVKYLYDLVFHLLYLLLYLFFLTFSSVSSDLSAFFW